MVAAEEARAVVEKARCKAEAETARLEVEQTSILLEIGVAKDEVSSLHSQANKDKEAMEVIFAYNYRCCVFKHNICGDQREVLDGMPDFSDPLPLEFFVSLRCPLVPMATEDTIVEVHSSEVAKKPEENSFAGDQN